MICRKIRPFVVSLAAVLTLPSTLMADGERYLVKFEKIRLTDKYYAEGASSGDFNHDGKTDIVCGPLWFEGPEFKKTHRFYPGKAYPNDRGYSDNFFSFVHDISGDGWDDVLVVGLPGTPAHWYENSRKDTPWKKRLAFRAADNEAPVFEDLTGDGKPELICTFQGRLGYASYDPSDLDREWTWHPISAKGKWSRFSHGLGIGDVDGDGRKDFLTPTGWWTQPPSLDGDPEWKHHPFRFCGGGAQIWTYDVDGDGDNDVITSLRAHAYGLSWFEQVKTDKPGISFKERKIMGARPQDNPFGVAFSQLHAVDLRDVDGDGLKDIVAGKCYWAHNGGDPGARDPAVVYWFQLVRSKDGVGYVPHLVDDDSGVGRQVNAVDVNGDGLTDIVCGNKKGTFVFLNRARKVSEDEWRKAQPRPRASKPDDS